ncbi:monooxygenase [Malassezia cuniculi]|uniref:Monooxygenase n=1 Tax=Malassezia cuniculi TaxID=948313 RepID=A0AAF0ER17_9BASI|nr:monooxygenase [Malassezia cuniculi]
MSSPQRVAIIGAGSAGLVALQQLLEVGGDTFQPVIFERRADIGGLWNLERDPGPCHVVVADDSGNEQGKVARGSYAYSEEGKVHGDSAMYEGLRVNVPVDLMAYRDYPLPEGTHLFPERTVIFEYLKRFADSFNASKYVRLNTRVNRLARDGKVWRIESEGPDGKNVDEFDRVIIASGWCNVPHVPTLPGLSKFKGEQMHSAWYRYPLGFRGKKVLVIGSFSSGTDVSRELCGGIVRSFEGSDEWNRQAAENPPGTGVTVYHSYRNLEKGPPLDYDPRDPNSPDWCRRINVVGPLDHVDDSGKVVLQDGTALDIDVIVWATGFWRALPYIDHESEPFASHPITAKPGAGVHYYEGGERPGISASPEVGGASCTTNLDDWQLFYQPDKSLALLGVPTHIIPFPLTQAQARVVAHYWSGKIGELRPVSRQLGTENAEKWTTERNANDVEAPAGSVAPVNHSITTPSEEAYTDALLAHIPGEGTEFPEWDHGPDSKRGREGWGKVTNWRRDRLKTRVQLRRDHLGY